MYTREGTKGKKKRTIVEVTVEPEINYLIKDTNKEK